MQENQALLYPRDSLASESPHQRRLTQGDNQTLSFSDTNGQDTFLMTLRNNSSFAHH
jgi:hypothetical protein